MLGLLSLTEPPFSIDFKHLFFAQRSCYQNGSPIERAFKNYTFTTKKFQIAQPHPGGTPTLPDGTTAVLSNTIMDALIGL